MDGSIPITTRTGIGLPGLATIAAALTQAMEVVVIGAGLPVAVDPAAMADPVAVAATRAVTIIRIHQHLGLPYSPIPVGARQLERAAVIVRHPHQYIAVRNKSTNERSPAQRQAARISSPPLPGVFAWISMEVQRKFQSSRNRAKMPSE